MANTPTLLLACALSSLLTLGCEGSPVEAGPCGPETCSGCCDESGQCISGYDDSVCGRNGAACAACSASTRCSVGACVPKSCTSQDGRVSCNYYVTAWCAAKVACCTANGTCDERCKGIGPSGVYDTCSTFGCKAFKAKNGYDCTIEPYTKLTFCRERIDDCEASLTAASCEVMLKSPTADTLVCTYAIGGR